ncbi:MAG TPA: ABC transporter permease subunit [Candidatus Angelobacter sp.]|jgi:phosphonate transport system permease protein
MSGLESALSLLRQFFPPDLSFSYIRAESVPLFETLEIAAGAMFLALIIGLLLSLIIGARLPGSRALYALLTSIRSIPDLTLAILCVVLVGLGPAAGILALTVFYAAAMGKIFSDLFSSADPDAIEALHATGATRSMVAFYGLLPLRLKDLLTYGGYEFESAIRASVIVGAVGAGGIGTELVGSLNMTDYHRATTLIIMLVALIASVDLLVVYVRKKPGLLLVLAAFGAAAAWRHWPHLIAVTHALKTFSTMVPPQLPAEALRQLPTLIGETLLIALGGTFMAVVFAVPLAVAAARNISPLFISFPVRRLLEALRAVPEIVWGLILLGIAGLGPRVGILALGLHSTGALGKLYAESLENVASEPVIAMASTGGSALSIAGFAVLPLAFAPMTVHTLFRFEWNMRAATIVGMIGAGAIGGALFNAQQLFFYRQMMAYVLITWAMIMIADAVNVRLRKHWRVSEEL